MNGGTIKFVRLSNRRTIELLDYRTVGPSNRRTIDRIPVVTILILSINVVLACKYIGQLKKKCFKFSRAAPHRQDWSDTIPTRNKS